MVYLEGSDMANHKYMVNHCVCAEGTWFGRSEMTLHSFRLNLICTYLFIYLFGTRLRPMLCRLGLESLL